MPMKTKVISSAIVMGWTLLQAPIGQAQTVDWSQLPPVVQRTINEQRGPQGVVSIQRSYRFGGPVYAVRLDGPGPNSGFYVTDAGTIIKSNDVASLGQSREVTFDALPVSVQNAIRSRIGNAAMDTIEMVTAAGQTSFDVPYHVNGQIMDLWLDPNGNVLTTSPSRTLLTSVQRIGFMDLPLPVRDALETYTNGNPIDYIEKGKIRGEPVYDVTVNQNGQKVVLRLTDNGALVRDAANDRFLAETGRLPAPAIATARIPTRVPLTDATSISFNQLPPAVMHTLQRYAGSDYVDKLEKGIALGQTAYQAVFRHAGETIPLRIAENGALFNDDVNSWSLAKLGQSPDLQGNDWRSAPTRVAMFNVQKLTFDQLPLPVQDTLRYYVPGAPLKDVVEGLVNGSPVYQANVRWRGEDVQLRMAEDGSLINDQNNGLFLAQFQQATGIPVSVGRAPVWQSERGSGSGRP